MLRRAAVALCAAAVLCGCSAGGGGAASSGGAGSEPALRHLSPDGVAWLVEWQRWSSHAEDESSLALDAPPVGAAESCARLRTKVGPPPGDDRLDGVWASARQECASIRRLARTSNRDGRLSDAELRAVDRIHASAQRSLREVDRLLVIGQRPPVSTDPAMATRIDPRFGRVADRIVRWGDISGGVPERITVRCYGPADWAPLAAEQRIFYPNFAVDNTIAFVVKLMPQTVFLSPTVCMGLDRIEAGERPSDATSVLSLGTAVNALAHESVHLTGVVDEAVTECRSVQLIVETAAFLGVDRAYAAKLRDAYWTEAYPRLSPAYRTSECHDGSTLDLDSSRHSFP